MKTLYTIGLRILKGHKKYCASVIFLQILFVILIVCVPTIIIGVNDSNFNIEANIYGLQHAILYDLDAQQKEALLNIDAEVGFVDVLDTPIIIHDKVINGGYADTQFMQIGHISLKAGAMPKNAYDVVLEDNLASSLGLVIGSDITVIIDGRREALHVTGIIYDYIGNWNTAQYSDEKNIALPQVLFNKNFQGKLEHKHALIHLKTASKTDLCGNQIDNLCEKLGITEYQNNTNLYQGQTSVETSLYNTCLLIFIAAMLIASFMITFNSASKFVKHIYDRFKIMRMIGGNRAACRKIIVAQQFIIAIISYLIGAVLAILMVIWLNYILDIDLYSGMPFLLTLAFALLTTLTIIVTCKLYKLVDDCMIIPVRNTSVMMVQRKSIVLQLANYNFQRYIKRFVTTIIAIGVCVSIFSVAGDFEQILRNQEASAIDYTIISQTGLTYDLFGRYQIIRNRDNGFSFSDLSQIRAFGNACNVHAEPYNRGIVLEMDDNRVDDYWSFWMDQSDFGYSIELNNSIATKETSCVSELSFVIVDQAEFVRLCEQYTTTAYAEMDGSIIIFAPPIEGKGQSAFSAGDMVVFSRLNKEGDNINYASYPYRIESIVDCPLAQDFGDSVLMYDKPTIVITENAAKSSGILSGYYIIDVSLVDKETAYDVEKVLKRLAAQHPNSTYFSTAAYQERNLQIDRMIKLLMSLLCAVIGGYGIITSGLLFYTRILENKAEYGLYRVLGLPIKKLILAIGIEGMYYLILSFLSGLCLTTIASMLLGFGMTYVVQYVDEIATICIMITLSMALVLLACVYKLLHQPLYDAIAINE